MRDGLRETRLVRSGTQILLGLSGPASEHAHVPPCCAGLSQAFVVTVDFVQRDADVLARPYRLGNVPAQGLGSDHGHFDLAASEAFAGLA